MFRETSENLISNFLCFVMHSLAVTVFVNNRIVIARDWPGIEVAGRGGFHYLLLLLLLLCFVFVFFGFFLPIFLHYSIPVTFVYTPYYSPDSHSHVLSFFQGVSLSNTAAEGPEEDSYSA